MTVKGFAPLCDWLTLASYKFTAYTDAAALFREFRPKGWKGGSWLQYSGFKHKDGLFYGHAVQSHQKEHYILRVSGTISHEVMEEVLASPIAQHFYATRIDIQRTIPAPEWWHPRKLKDYLDGEAIVSSMIESDTGSTVYIGSRSSGRFTRLYEKRYEKLYVRLEIELKGDYARTTWGLLQKSISVSSLYSANLDKLPLFERAIRDYMPDGEHDLDLKIHRKIIDEKRQLEWLKSLVPKFHTMANSHEIGDMVRDIFASLALEERNDDPNDIG